MSVPSKILIFILCGAGAVLLIPQIKSGISGEGQAGARELSAAAPAQTADTYPRRVYLFAQTTLHTAANGRMTPSSAAIKEGLLTALESPVESGDFTWLRVRDERTGSEGWVYEHLTSNEAVALDSKKELAIGQERVDRFYALPHDYRPGDLVPLDMRYCRIRQIELRQETAEAFIALHTAAAREGIHLYGFSGYRSYDYQRELYLNRIKIWEKHRQRFVARPGHTEHQLGTTLDVVGRDTNFAAQNGFDTTSEAAWLRAECYRYGFVLSYGKDNTVPTGYGYESWHIRYVGKENAVAWIRTHLAPENPIYKKYIPAGKGS